MLRAWHRRRCRALPEIRFQSNARAYCAAAVVPLLSGAMQSAWRGALTALRCSKSLTAVPDGCSCGLSAAFAWILTRARCGPAPIGRSRESEGKQPAVCAPAPKRGAQPWTATSAMRRRRWSLGCCEKGSAGACAEDHARGRAAAAWGPPGGRARSAGRCVSMDTRTTIALWRTSPPLPRYASRAARCPATNYVTADAR